MTTGANTYLESEGKSVQVDLSFTVAANQVAVVEGWLGITADSGDSGDTIALTNDRREYQFTVPDLSLTKGDIVYIEVADLTGHTPDDTAYSTTAGAGKVAFFKCTSDQYVDADGNPGVDGILLGQLAS